MFAFAGEMRRERRVSTALARSRTPVADLLALTAEWRATHPEDHSSSFKLIDQLAWLYGRPLVTEAAHHYLIDSWEVYGLCPSKHDDIIASLLAAATQARADST